MLLVERNLRHGALQLVQPKQRIVAETAGAQGNLQNLSFDHAFASSQYNASARGCQHASIARSTLSSAPHAIQEIEVVALIRRVRVRRIVPGILSKSGGANAGRTAQSIHLESGVIGEDDLRREAAVILRLQAGVAGKRRLNFFGCRNGAQVRQRFQRESTLKGSRGEVAQFAGIG